MRPRERILRGFQERIIAAAPIAVPTMEQVLRAWVEEQVLAALVDSVPSRLSAAGTQTHKDGNYIEAVCSGTTHADHPCTVTIAMLLSAPEGELRVHLYVEEPQLTAPVEKQWVLKSDDSVAHLAAQINKELHDI